MQCFQVNERLWVFAPRASVLELISLMRLDGRKNIQNVKSARLVLHVELKAQILPPLLGNNSGR